MLRIKESSGELVDDDGRFERSNNQILNFCLKRSALITYRIAYKSDAKDRWYFAACNLTYLNQYGQANVIGLDTKNVTSTLLEVIPPVIVQSQVASGVTIFPNNFQFHRSINACVFEAISSLDEKKITNIIADRKVYLQLRRFSWVRN